MELKRVWAMYFSPTGGTEKAVKTTAQALAAKLGFCRMFGNGDTGHNY